MDRILSEKRFVRGQIEMEQKVLALPEIQRDTLSLLLASKSTKNATYLRLIYYSSLVQEKIRNSAAAIGEKSAIIGMVRRFADIMNIPPQKSRAAAENIVLGYQDSISRDSQEKIVETIREKSSAEVEKKFRSIAKRASLGIELPSNKKFESELDKLVKSGYVSEVASSSPRKTVAYQVSKEFIEEWAQIRQNMLEAIKNGKIKKKWLSQLSKKFWMME